MVGERLVKRLASASGRGLTAPGVVPVQAAGSTVCLPAAGKGALVGGRAGGVSRAGQRPANCRPQMRARRRTGRALVKLGALLRPLITLVPLSFAPRGCRPPRPCCPPKATAFPSRPPRANPRPRARSSSPDTMMRKAFALAMIGMLALAVRAAGRAGGGPSIRPPPTPAEPRPGLLRGWVVKGRVIASQCVLHAALRLTRRANPAARRACIGRVAPAAALQPSCLRARTRPARGGRTWHPPHHAHPPLQASAEAKPFGLGGGNGTEAAQGLVKGAASAVGDKVRPRAARGRQACGSNGGVPPARAAACAHPRPHAHKHTYVRTPRRTTLT